MKQSQPQDVTLCHTTVADCVATMGVVCVCHYLLSANDAVPVAKVIAAYRVTNYVAVTTVGTVCVCVTESLRALIQWHSDSNA